MRHLVLPSFLIISLAPTALLAQGNCCCGRRAPLIREELRDSDVVWVVRVEFANQDPKSEERDLTIVDAVKEHPKLANKHIVRHAGAIPIPDAINPPKFLVAGNLHKGDVDLHRGYEATPEMLAYATGLLRFHPMDHRQTLRFCSGFLDSACKEVQADAFREFAEADAADVKAREKVAHCQAAGAGAKSKAAEGISQLERVFAGPTWRGKRCLIAASRA